MDGDPTKKYKIIINEPESHSYQIRLLKKLEGTSFEPGIMMLVRKEVRFSQLGTCWINNYWFGNAMVFGDASNIYHGKIIFEGVCFFYRVVKFPVKLARFVRS